MKGQTPIRAIVRAWALIVAAIMLDPAVADKNVAGLMIEVLGSDNFNIRDDGHVVNITWRCPGSDGEEQYCLEGSMLSYVKVMEAARDRRIDVRARTLHFETRMPRKGRDGNDHAILLLAATWGGDQLMKTDWKTTSVAGAIDAVSSVEADPELPDLLGATRNLQLALWQPAPVLCVGQAVGATLTSEGMNEIDLTTMGYDEWKRRLDHYLQLPCWWERRAGVITM